MCCKKKHKTQRPPRKPRQGPYRKVNAYSTKYEFQQVLTLVIMILLIVLHSIFIVIPLVNLNNHILILVLVLYFIILIILIADYIKITTFDPVDSLILDPVKLQIQKKENIYSLKKCQVCRSFVYNKSYHCNRCNRCTEKFDHHCAFLGSCIGGKNYQIFFRILLFFTLFNISILIQAIWVFVQIVRLGQSEANSFTRWGIIPLIALAGGVLIGALVLCAFHLHISCCVDLTTIEFVQSSSSSSFSKQKIENEQKMAQSPQALQQNVKF